MSSLTGSAGTCMWGPKIIWILLEYTYLLIQIKFGRIKDLQQQKKTVSKLTILAYPLNIGVPLPVYHTVNVCK